VIHPARLLQPQGFALLLLTATALPLTAPPPTTAAPLPQLCAAPLQAARAQQETLPALGRGQQVLLLGEIHTSGADHAWQLQSLETLQRAGVPLQLGLEMVPAPRQPALDRYTRGQIDETTFLREVGWGEVWGHDPALYLPLLRWARRQGVPLLALNAEPALVKRVRRGGLAVVPEAERQGIGEPAPAGVAYRERLRASWQAHGGEQGQNRGDGMGGGRDLEAFIDSQRLRDRAMAERLAAARRAEPQRLVVALIGRGHLGVGEGGAREGVPAQLQDLGIRQTAVLLRPEVPPPCSPAPPGARLGAYLESEGEQVWVRRVAAGSAAAAGGLQPGDRIVAVNDEAVQRAGQVIRRVANHPPEKPLRLTLERAGRRRIVVLHLPAAPAASRGNADGENGATPGPRGPSP
jgi:uncharacterized iron-regulated protein